MAGRINDEDIALVRERVRIDEVVGEYVTLRNAGGGSLKGLCPFHDEKTPSFQVTPSRGLFYCFGCGEGGDTISFLQKIDNLTFVEAVQRLADKVGVQLRIVDDGRPGLEPGLRMQILAANEAAAQFFQSQMSTDEGRIAREFVAERGFSPDAAVQFGMGYAPRGGHVLRDHLMAKGFTPKVLIESGLVRSQGWDFFQGRVLWPIKDSGKSVLGFGARRVYDDDRLPAKYVNTPETPVYKKSHVLYGLDMARANIGKKSQAVIVEGYTDVMAAHLSGVDTAVAACGTAFGDDHARLIQRLMGNSGSLNGEVIFTFDGDAAGQKAALKVFRGDNQFSSQTYVAIEPTGLDPCDLLMQRGPQAVRELVARRVPLYRYVMENTVSQFDLDRADGRVAAIRAAAPLVTSIRDQSLVDGYLRELSQVVGADIDVVRREVSRARKQRRSEPQAVAVASPQQSSGTPWPDPADVSLSVERGFLKLALQYPDLFDEEWDQVEVEDLRHPAYQAVFDAVLAVPRGQDRWAEKVGEATPDPLVKQLEVALLVEPVLREEPDRGYAQAYAARVRLLSITDDIANLKSRLQRTNPNQDRKLYDAMFSDLVTLEALRKSLIAAGGATSA
ncbi:DNA primase [Cutibacterium sp. WCA-380-WT-3A]|uniref:DNA primase n=2 Tax=Cutibacterium porci TaxID=2605781 RepID=A0A7K0J6W7_9ACTN|nr:DNA primase [Cutibacterium porci]